MHNAETQSALRSPGCSVSSLAMTTEKAAIVTGAGKRIGRSIASALVKDGWTVVAHVHHEDDDVSAGARKVVADLADIDCAGRIFGAADGAQVGLLVNSAARFHWDALREFDPGEFDAHMAINVRAPILLIEELARRHQHGEDALVVNILDSKLAAPNPDYLSYTLSKQALAGLTELAARALAPAGIRVNAIAPGLMLQSSGQSEANFSAMHRRNPLGRGVEAEDLVGAIRYLLEARTVTGHTIIADSGHRFMNLERDVQFLGQGDG